MIHSHHRDEDILATERMVAENRDFFRERSFHLCVWGLLLSGLYGVEGAISMGLLAPVAGIDGWLWVATILAAVLLSFVFERYRALSPANILSRLLRNIWGAVGVALIIVGFLGGATALMPAPAHCGSLAALVGVGFFASAALVASRALLVLAVLWWLGAAALFFLTGFAALFLMLCLLVGGLFLPALALYWTHHTRPSEG